MAEPCLIDFVKGLETIQKLTMNHNKFIKAKEIPFEIAGVDYEKRKLQLNQVFLSSSSLSSSLFSEERTCLIFLYLSIISKDNFSVKSFFKKPLLNKLSSIQLIVIDQPLG